jgi:hypothetical protein
MFIKMATIQAQPNREMLLEWLAKTQKKWVWQKIAELKEYEMEESIEAKYFPPMTSEEYRVRVDKAMQQYRSGNYSTLEDFEKETETW